MKQAIILILRTKKIIPERYLPKPLKIKLAHGIIFGVTQ